MINKLINSISPKSFAIFKELILKNKKNFLILVLMLLFQILILSLAIVSIVPLADYLVDEEMRDPNKITQFILNSLNFFNIEKNLTFFLLFFAAMAIFKTVVEIIITKHIYLIRYNLEKDLFSDFTKKIFKTNWNFFFKYNSGSLLNTYTNIINQICAGFTAIAVQISKFIKLIAYLVIPTLIDYKITLFAIIFAIIALLPVKFFTKMSYDLGTKNLKANDVFLKNLSETFQSIKLIFGFNKSDDTYKKNQSSFNEVIKYGLKTAYLNLFVSNSFYPIGLGVAAITFAIFMDRATDLSILAAVFWSLVSAVPVLQSLVQGNLEVANLSANYEQYKNVVKDANEMKFINGEKKFLKLKNSLEFKDVVFSYDNIKNVINDVSFEIKKNQTYLISGASGSGKSTLIDLIMGFQKPLSGKIFIDENILSDLDIFSYRSKIGYVPQEPFLYDETIYENIVWANPNIKKDDLDSILDISNCKEFIKSFKDGINTKVGERGNMLSGGQKQRIALARALAKNPEILILDEATNSLDKESSILIKNSLSKLNEKCTIIIISHEFEFFKSVNEILYMENGKIKIRK